MGLQVRKTNDDTNNKGASRLTWKMHLEIDQTSKAEIFLPVAKIH